MLRIKLARQAYKAKELPITITKNTKINKPLAGSEANECTEVRMPERTKNVPSKLSENPEIANNTVQCLKAPRFSLTLKECTNAVATSQGIKEAFSTGSQNHQPPQPNS